MRKAALEGWTTGAGKSDGGLKIKLILAACALSPVPTVALDATHNWTGERGDHLFSTPENWADKTSPDTWASGDNVVLFYSSAETVIFNDVEGLVISCQTVTKNFSPLSVRLPLAFSAVAYQHVWSMAAIDFYEPVTFGGTTFFLVGCAAGATSTQGRLVKGSALVSAMPSKSCVA